MKTITTAHVTSDAPPAAFFARWADMSSWPQWNADTEWARLDGPFAAGSTGRLKPRGGPRVRFVIETLTPGSEFTDLSKLAGAHLRFSHVVGERPGGGCEVDVAVSISGPLAALWMRLLGDGIRSSAQSDLERLAALAEADRESAAHAAIG